MLVKQNNSTEFSYHPLSGCSGWALFPLRNGNHGVLSSTSLDVSTDPLVVKEQAPPPVLPMVLFPEKNVPGVASAGRFWHSHRSGGRTGDLNAFFPLGGVR